MIPENVKLVCVGTKDFWRIGPIFEHIMHSGLSLSAEWEPTQDRFRKCRINGRFVTEKVYCRHRMHLKGAN